MSLLKQFFQFRGDAPAMPKTMRDLGVALRATEGSTAPQGTADTSIDSVQAIPRAPGPCREDPALPALNIQPTADRTTDVAVILGKPPEPAAVSEQPMLIHVTPRPPRIAPLVAAPPTFSPGPRDVLLRVETNSPTDADALIRHVESFPGVIKCSNISGDAHG